MGSKREEERNEKIIRGLIKLPPNRRCINCNSLGPQYVCTNFWTFICTTCSGIHREFTHRVKSISMAKFTFQEVDALQKGGNQRARELFMKAWDPQSNRLPDNSNIDKLRDFIKNVYVDKKYSLEKSSDRPPRDPQSLRSHEDETRRASSYHSYSQSPPYDFQYEERRYGKPAHALTRNPSSDRGLYKGKLAGFLSSARLSDYTNDDRFANEGSNSRMSDFSGSGGSDPFRSDVLSPSYLRDTGSPFSETSRGISREVSSLNNSDADSNKFHPQRTSSSGSFGSFDCSSMSFKSTHSLSFPEVGSELGRSADISHGKSASLPSLSQSSASRTFDGLDLFNAPFAPENVTSIPPTGSSSHGKSASVPSLSQSSVSRTFDGLDLFNAPFAPESVTSIPPTGSSSQLIESLSTQSANFIQQSTTSSIPSFTEQQASQILQPSPLDLFMSQPQRQSAASDNGKTSDVEIPNDGGWATFDMPQNIVPVDTEKSAPATVSSSDESVRGTFNPFSIDNSYQDSVGQEPSASTFNFGPQSLNTVESTITGTHLWNAFDAADRHPAPNVLKINEQAALRSASDAEKSAGEGEYEYSNNLGSITTPNESEPPSSSLSSHFNMTLSDFPIGLASAEVHSFKTDHKPTNPFDLPYDSDKESTNMPQFWNMSSLQVALPNLQMPASYVTEVDQSWFPQNSVSSFIPGGVPFDSPSGSLGFMAGQAPNTSMSSIHAEAPVASVGGNPFA